MDLAALVSDLSPWLVGHDFDARWPERRLLQPRILSRLQDPALRRASVVIGPRQVGKSVILWQIAEDLLRAGWPAENLVYFDFADDRVVEPISTRDVILAAESVRRVRSAATRPSLPLVLLLDEISRVPRWDRWLKTAVDAGGQRIVATDSAASMLRDGARESGHGRWDEIVLEGLSLSEFRRIAPEGAAFERFLRLGGFPAFASGFTFAEARRALREDIVSKALERDLVHRLQDVEAARRFFVYLVQDSGAIYNASKRQADLRIDRKQATLWVQLFLDTRLLVRLPRRALDSMGKKVKASGRLGGHPKLYAADHGLIHAFSPLPDPDDDPIVRGQVFEGVVFRNLREVASEQPGSSLTFSRGDSEGDFVLDTEDGAVLVEVTSARTGKGKVSKLKSLREQIGADRAILVHGGIDVRRDGEVTLVPLPLFLEDPSTVLRGGNP
jgi:hypothetical protein